MKNIKGYPLPLGVTERNGVVNFSLEVESGKTCNLCIYKKGQQEPEVMIELKEDTSVGSVRFIALPLSEVRGRTYNYEIDGKKKLDAYVKSYVQEFGESRGKILPDYYDWEEDKPLEIPDSDVIAYSLHVRGFTKHRTSRVKNKGTFRGLIEKIPYLKELGINQILCMPIYDFDENTPYKNYWGYGDAFCFAIKKSYAASKDTEREFKDMVKRFHQNRIEVVLNLPFTEHTPKQLIIDCLHYYVMEYHVDGFVLNPYVAPMESIRTDGILKRTKILENREDYQNTMRRFLRGDCGIVQSAIRNMKQIAAEKNSYNYMTNHTGFTLADLVSYNKKHNQANGENNCDGPSENYSWNCGKEGNTKKTDILELRNRQRRNAMALLLLSQGTPLILAGDEFGNLQKGNNNVYCQDNETAWLNWTQLEKDRGFFEYVKALICLRKTYSVFTPDFEMKGIDCLGCGIPDISYHTEDAWKIDDKQKEPYMGIYYHGEDDTDCFVAYNMQDRHQEFALPSLKNKKEWFCVFTTDDESVRAKEDKAQNQRKTMVEPRTITMFVGK